MLKFEHFGLVFLFIICISARHNFCPNGTFFCGNSNSNLPCITEDWVCDNYDDCDNGQDEINCTINKCNSNAFKCKEMNKCIDKNLKCDQYYDCADKSDESNCSRSKCSENQFDCKRSDTLKCIDNQKVCNEHNDCENNQDEISPCQKKKFCTPNSCKHICIDHKGNYECKCLFGFELDIKTNSKCIKLKSNNNYRLFYKSRESIFSFKLWESNKPAKIYDNDRDIYYFSVAKDEENIILFHNKRKVINRLFKTLISYQYDKDSCIFPVCPIVTNWDYVTGVTSTLPGRSHNADVSFKILSYDDNYKLLFWADDVSHTINCLNSTNGQYTKLFNYDNGHTINYMKVDTVNKRIFWLEELPSKKTTHPDYAIKRANYNSDNEISTVVFGSNYLRHTTALHYDASTDRIYWVNQEPPAIKFITVSNGPMSTATTVVEHRDFRPVDITIIGDKLIWSDWIQQRIYQADKTTGLNIVTIIKAPRAFNLQIITDFAQTNQWLNNTTKHQETHCLKSCPANCVPGPSKDKCFGSADDHSNFWVKLTKDDNKVANYKNLTNLSILYSLLGVVLCGFLIAFGIVVYHKHRRHLLTYNMLRRSNAPSKSLFSSKPLGDSEVCLTYDKQQHDDSINYWERDQLTTGQNIANDQPATSTNQSNTNDIQDSDKIDPISV